MPKRSSHRLTDKQCRAATEGDLFDGDGLTLAVRGGGKSWLQRYTFDGRRKKIGLGPYPLIGLKEARRLGEEVRRMVLRGIDPAVERTRQRNQKTFGQIMEEYLSLPGTSDDPRWPARLENHFGTFLPRMIGSIGSEELASALTALALRKAPTAEKVLSEANKVFQHAFAIGAIDANPMDRAKLALNTIMANTPKLHHPMVAPEDAPKLYADLLAREPDPCLLALRLIMLMPARAGNVRFARWSQIDMEKRVWTVMAKETKTGKKTGTNFVAPLGREAFATIELAQKLYGEESYIFPGAKIGKPLSENTIAKRMKSFGYRDPSDDRLAVPHGLRATMKTFLTDFTELDQNVVERMLDHKVKDAVQKAYDRAKLVERRREISDIWADHLLGRDNPNIIHFLGSGVVREDHVAA